MNRLQKIIISGGVAVLLYVLAHFVLVPAVKNRSVESAGSTSGSPKWHIGAIERTSGFAPVALWWEDPDGRWKARDTIRLSVLNGLAAHEGRIIPTEELTAYLDHLVVQGRCSYVLLTLPADSTWGEIIPLIDACRRSKVDVVLLNHVLNPPNKSPQRNARMGWRSRATLLRSTAPCRSEKSAGSPGARG